MQYRVYYLKMGSSMEVPKSIKETSEQEKFSYIQAYLALTNYLTKEGLGINPAVLLSRTEKRTEEQDSTMHKIHKDAMAMWFARPSADEPPLVELFREYWDSHKGEVETLDLTNAFACLELVKKVRGVRNEKPGIA